MALNVLQRLYHHARTRPTDLAIAEFASEGHAQRSATFAQLATMVQTFATSIEYAVEPGDVVIVCQPNVIECTAAFLATLHARTVGFLINPTASRPELRAAALAASAKAIFGTPEAQHALSDLDIVVLSPIAICDTAVGDTTIRDAPPDHAGSGLMLLSSGTTGDPKIVLRDGPSLDAVARNVVMATGLTQDDHVLGMVPLCHSYGVEHGILAPTTAGCCVHLCQGFDARAIVEPLQTGIITVLPGVPSVFERLASLGNGTVTFSRLRCAYSAGSRLPMSVFEACREKLGLRVGQLYGSSEVGSVTFNDANAPGHVPMSVGTGMQGVTIKIVDPNTRCLEDPLPPGEEGELAIHSPSMLRAYVGQEASPTTDGYFFTGDLARLNAHGELTITGRIKLLIDVGAFKVNPLDVEAVLTQHDDVQACAVLAAPLTDTISRLRALVVPRDHDQPPSPESLRRFARSRLSAHKIPRVFEIVASLPRSPTGKLLRRKIPS